MREIKFRGWDEKNKEMVSNINLLFSNHLNERFEEYEECGLKIMQYTGLKDKNGKEIYEGDIVRWKDLESFDDFPVDEVLKVEYSDEFMKWITCNKNDWQDDLYDFTDNRDLEVIGNIFENPELL